jgi:hypothetical protein
MTVVSFSNNKLNKLSREIRSNSSHQEKEWTLKSSVSTREAKSWEETICK